MAAGMRKYLAIALVSAAVILLQVTVTRILSVVIWYHWAFFSISLAMLGIGAPGVWFSFWKPQETTLDRLLLASTVAVPAGIIAIIKASRPMDQYAILICMAALLPAMLTLGAAVVALLLEAKGPRIGKMYAFDLLGACVGALLVVPLMMLVPTPQLAGAIGFLPLAAYLLLGAPVTPAERESDLRTASGADISTESEINNGTRQPRLKRLFLAVAAGTPLVLALLLGSPFVLRHSKTYVESGPQRTPIFEKWTPTARITVFDNLFFMDQPDDGFGWGYGSVAPTDQPPRQYWIEQDGSAGTPMTQFDGNIEEHDYLFHDVATVGYQLRPPKKVAIIGAGGGRDILAAKLAGAESTDAIELNGVIVDVVRDHFREFSGGLYDLPGVNAIVGEGRSVLTRMLGGYDLIQISMIDSWAATAAGAFSLSENNLYTIEAYRLYWSQLSDRGMVSTSRYMMGGVGLEVPRLLYLVVEALKAEGVESPRDHIAVFQGHDVGAVLMSKKPFDRREKQRMLDIAKRRGFALHLPITNLPPELRSPELMLDRGPAALLQAGVRLDPPTDDQPFFFQVFSPFRRVDERVVSHYRVNTEGVTALRTLMIVMAVVTLVVFFAPFAASRGQGIARSDGLSGDESNHLSGNSSGVSRGWIERAPGFWRGSLFFISIGLSFMFIEIALVQRFILYLGHPSLATTACLGCLLLGAGTGSMISTRFGVARARSYGFLAAVLLGGLNLTLGPLFAATLGWDWAARVVVTVATVVPAGFVMGFFFPLGMVRFGDANRAWYWALNGAAGVLASVASLAASMEIGFSNVAWLGTALYVAAWLLLLGREPAIK